MSAPAVDATTRRRLWLAGVLLLFLVIDGAPPVAGYLERRWPDVGLGGALFIALFLGAGLRAPDGERDRVLVWNWLLLLVYLLHQFEEHGVDLLGRHYAFQAYANARLAFFGLELSASAILRINTLAVWLAFLLAVWGGRRLPWPGLAAVGLVLTNGLVHLSAAVGRGEYNPGVASSVLLFLPVSWGYLRQVPAECGLGGRAVAAGIGYAVLIHLAIPAVIAADAPLVPLYIVATLPLVANAVARRAAVVA